MKQNVVIKVSTNSQKSRSKALKMAVSASSVESAALKGDDKNQIEVTGDGIDAAQLTRLLRKKFGHAILESVSAAGDQKKEENKGTENEAKMMKVAWPTRHATVPLYHVVRDPCNHDPYSSCFIL